MKSFRALVACSWLLAFASSCDEEEKVVPAQFRILVEAGDAAFQGADTLVKVTLERDAGFTADVEVVLEGAQGTFGAPELRFSKSKSYGYLRISVDSSADVAEVKLTALATSGAQSVAEPFTLDVREEAPFTQQLIEAARSDGEIDDATALLYRGYAAFGDARLPEEYRGAGSYEEDIGLVPDIVALLPELDPEMQAALEQFSARPSEPNSWFNADLPSEPTTRAGGLPPKTCAELGPGLFQWASQRSEVVPARVWAPCIENDDGFNAVSMQMMAETLAIVEVAWKPEGKLMGNAAGNPILDEQGGGDDAIDFYLDRGSPIVRDGEPYATNNLGEAFPCEPQAGRTSSGFVIIGESTHGTPRFHTTVMHELFHVFQFRHNAELSGSVGKHWFYEASATWAAAYFDRTLDSLWTRPRGAYAASHARFKARFQKSGLALNDQDDLHARAAYIWPYFLEQTVGHQTIGQIWLNLEGATTIAQADDIIDTAYSFETNFRKFALRNINEELTPGDPVPKDKRHVSGDEAQFLDDGAPPGYVVEETLEEEGMLETSVVEIQPLSARYLKYTVTNTNLKQFVFELPDPVISPELDIDALVKINGKWESKPRDLNGMTQLKLCEPLEEIRFILSNHQYGENELIYADIGVTASASACQATWTGTASHELFENGGSLRVEAQVTWILDPAQSGPGIETYYPEGIVTVTQTEADCTITYAPTTGAIVNDGMSNLYIVPDMTGEGFTAFGGGITIWDTTRTDVCPMQVPVTTESQGQIGGNWFIYGLQVPVSADGKTIQGTSGTMGNVFEFNFTKN